MNGKEQPNLVGMCPMKPTVPSMVLEFPEESKKKGENKSTNSG